MSQSETPEGASPLRVEHQGFNDTSLNTNYPLQIKQNSNKTKI